METTLGGERLGSGKKQTLQLRNFERSSHDLGYTWRSTMAPGTLVPFMVEVGLPGDTFDIDLNAICMTHPTIGPLFGSFKLQLDVFQVPMRLYNGKLHMNKLGIGMDMSKIKIPQIKVTADTNQYVTESNDQINPSALLSYLNIRGIGTGYDPSGQQEDYRYFNAIPYLAYMDIAKNYYFNKMEDTAYIIHSPNTIRNNFTSTVIVAIYNIYTGESIYVDIENEAIDRPFDKGSEEVTISIIMQNANEPRLEGIKLVVNGNTKTLPQVFNCTWNNYNREIYGTLKEEYYNSPISTSITEFSYDNSVVGDQYNEIELYEFPIANIDTMREDILTATKNAGAFVIDENSIEPYNLMLKKGNGVPPKQGLQAWSKLSSQEGLLVKTYQSDLFNNWLNTEWIEGGNGINEITAIDTSSGSFSIDTLNIANKVYNMLNQIAMSGGSYDDWLSAVYTHERIKSVESPMYMGGLIKELTFDEVVSTAGTSLDEQQPLGTLAGRGVMTNKHKGGTVRIKVDEPSYIMGIVSLTPRISYSQGNKWDVNLKTFNDFHNPHLDQIGFQDLITDAMDWRHTRVDQNNITYFKSSGKQPAWINYMTNVDVNRGNFADEKQQMFMVLDRKYSFDGREIDATTYIDPTKFNQIFADTRLDAQNFWMQIRVDNTARRKMSAKIIPNL